MEAVQITPVFVTEGIVVKQRGSQFFQHLTDDLPVGWAKIRTKGLTTREEELVRDDIRERTHDVGVQFNLPECRLDIISMSNYV
jgi:hypothetical protein